MDFISEYKKFEMRILLADRCSLTRFGVLSIIGGCFDTIRLDQATNPAQLLSMVEREHYSVVVVDPIIYCNGMISIVPSLKMANPSVKVLVFTAMDVSRYGVQALRDGALGYVTKNSSIEEFITALKKVVAGGKYFSKAIGEEIALVCNGTNALPHENLTKRESQIFAMLVSGWTIGKIADDLGLSVKTVSSHKMRILAKVRCPNMSALVQYAIAQKLLYECRSRCELV